MMHLFSFALLILLSATSIAAAQTGEIATPKVGTTRVAVVNVGYVFYKYEKAQAFKKNLEASIQPYKEQAAKLTGLMKRNTDAIRNRDFSRFTEDDLNRGIKKAQRELEDLEAEIKGKLGKLQEDNLLQLWKEMQEAIKTYAKRGQLDLVLAYGDPIDKSLLDQFPNVNRKMQAMDTGSVVPLFIAPNTDISAGVTEILNERYRVERKKLSEKGAKEL